jgi:hypothetical protein
MKQPQKGADYRKELTDKFEKFRSIRNELQHLRFEMAMDMRELFTNEQIAKFAAMTEKQAELSK